MVRDTASHKRKLIKRGFRFHCFFFLPGSSPQTGGSKSIRGPDASVQIVCLQHKPSFLLYSVLARWLFF